MVNGVVGWFPFHFLYLYSSILNSQVHASTVISLLQSDIKTALKSAFPNLEGPLSVTDWCKGRNQLVDTGSIVDGVSAESSINECRDSSEPMSPSQSSVGGSSSIKGRSLCRH